MRSLMKITENCTTIIWWIIWWTISRKFKSLIKNIQKRCPKFLSLHKCFHKNKIKHWRIGKMCQVYKFRKIPAIYSFQIIMSVILNIRLILIRMIFKKEMKEMILIGAKKQTTKSIKMKTVRYKMLKILKNIR